MEAARFVQYARKKTARWSDEAKSVVRRRHELVRQQQATIVNVVSNEFALSATAFQEQGDAELNTEAAFRARQQLRRDPGILAALDQWWNTALGTARLIRSIADSLIEADYVHIAKMLYRDLLGPSQYDDDAAQAAALEDWEADAGTATTMGRAAFM